MGTSNRSWHINAVNILAFISILAPFCLAKDKPTQSETQRVSVIAHLPIEGAPVSQLFVQEEGGKQYLYIRQASQSGYTIVDVSHANKPKIVKRDTSQLSNGLRLQMIGGGIALSEQGRERDHRQEIGLHRVGFKSLQNLADLFERIRLGREVAEVVTRCG